jgi:glucosylceramidase
MEEKNQGMNKAGVIQTAKHTKDRLTPQKDIIFSVESEKPRSGIRIACDPDIEYQKIIGFGGAFTEAGATVLAYLNAEERAGIIERYFHPQKGLAYSLCRTHINSCDFSLGNYSCNDTPEDINLRNFNINRDKKYLIPFIQSALGTEKARFRLIASPWSPPAWMKTNKQMNNGGTLRPECKKAWALFYAKYIKAYGKAGIPIWGITVQNEPDAVQVWDSCIYTGEQERDFVRDYLGPCLVREGLEHIKIIIWDHNRDLLFERAKTVLSDRKAARYVWGVGFHWYSGNQFKNVLKTYKTYPAKPLLLTEACIEGGVKLGAWDRGEIYAHNIINDINNGAAGWIDWNMVLNSNGGPNHAGNYCDAPVIVDQDSGEVYLQSSFYYIGHFSKYVRHGAVRIHAEASRNELETIAFKNPDRSMVIVILNRDGLALPFQVCLGNNVAERTIPPHAIITLLIPCAY